MSGLHFASDLCRRGSERACQDKQNAQALAGESEKRRQLNQLRAVDRFGNENCCSYVKTDREYSLPEAGVGTRNQRRRSGTDTATPKKTGFSL